MKEKNSKLNDPAYFDSLNQKMMDYADEHPHTTKRTFPLYAKWLSAAAVILLGITSILYLNREEVINPAIAVTPMDTSSHESPSANIPSITQEVIPVQINMNPVQMSALEQFGSDEEVIEDIVPLENIETDSELLDEITEEELDELLKEYT